MTPITKPATTIKIEIQGNQIDLKYPQSGEMIDLALLKSKLSDGQYSNLLFQRSNDSDIALKLIDAFCFFTVMLPDLKKSLQVKSFYDLEILQATELIHVYDEQISPWLDGLTESVNNRLLELRGEETGKRQLV